MKTRVVFIGSPEFALPSLEVLAQQVDVVGVVTQPDRRAGRGRTLTPPPVKAMALELNLPVIQPPKLRHPEAFEQLQAWQPDVIVVAAYGQILRKNILTLPPHGCINVHASLLPRGRGAAPINAAILHGDQETGVTIMQMDAGLDTGPILSQRAIPIEASDTGGTLSVKLADLGAALLADTLPDYLAGKITPQPQDDSLSTYAPMLSKADGQLDFSQPAEALARQVRAYHPWPGTFTTWHGKPLKIHKATATSGGGGQPGRACIHQGLPAITTGAGLLLLNQLQPAGKKVMPGTAFLSGARDWENTNLPN